MKSLVSTLFLLLLAGAASAAAQPRAAARPAAAAVDSALGIPEALRRFRAGLAPVRALSGGARSRDELVHRFVRAVETHDTASLRAIVLTRTEFAYLYYPHTEYTRPPRTLEPGLLWFMMQQNSEKGIVRVLRRYGGQSLGQLGHRCGAAPRLVGAARVWEGCTLLRRAAGGAVVEERLFGSVLERDGVYKLVSYANDL